MLSRFVASAAKKATTLSWRQIHVASVLNAIEVRVVPTKILPYHLFDFSKAIFP